MIDLNIINKPRKNTILPFVISTLVILVIANITLVILKAPQLYPDEEIIDVVSRLCTQLTFYVISMLIIVITMYTDEFNKVNNNDYTARDFVPMMILFGILAAIPAIMDISTDIMCYTFLIVNVIIIIASFVGGWKLCITTSIFGLLSTLLYLIQDDNENIEMMMLSSMLILIFCVIGCILYLFRKKIENAPILTVSIIAIIVFAVLWLIFNPKNNANGMIIDTIISLILFILSIMIYFVNMGYVKKSRINEKNMVDLSLAHKIQLSVVPSEFKCSRTLDYHGIMDSAIEMCGDFYDFFEIKHNLLFITVADVSDKGLLAAMFMMKAKATLKAIAIVENDPSKIMDAANKELCKNNETEQFVTVWIGILDVDTGMLYHSDAGHPAPLIRNKSGEYKKMEQKKGMLLGSMDFVKYHTSVYKLQDGDSLFIFTDGVTEAMRADGTMYGSERLLSKLNSLDCSAEDTVRAVREDIRSFVEGNEMSDDITMFNLRVNRSMISEITVDAETSNLDRLIEFVDNCLISEGCPQKNVKKMDVVVEELFVNICSYAYPDNEGKVTVFCRYVDNIIKITFYDTGVKFDPVQRSEVIIGHDVSEWSIGGFGIHMVKKLVDTMDYIRIGDANVFTVTKKTENSE